MIITLNNQPYEVAEHATLQSLVLQQPGAQQNGIAIAVNNTVIARSAHADYQLQAGDQVLIIKATQGG